MPLAPATAAARHWRRRSDQPGRRRPHLITCFLAGAIALGVTVGLPTAAQAAGNSLYLPGGGDHVNLGANASLYIDGTLTYDDHCEWDKEGGVDDFFYPATDVYIVPAGSVSMGDALHDAGGQYPNTIIGTGEGAFLDEPIAVVYPTGKLGDGVYDVVYDTCQDHKLTASDTVFSNAITVDVPDGQIPPVDPSIKTLKDRAREEYATWLKMHIGLTAILKIGSAKSIAACLLNPTDSCMASILQGIYGPSHILAKANGRVTSQALALVANQAAHYGAIWQDPADPDFDHLPVVETHGAPDLVAPGRPIPDSFVAMQPSLQQQDALTDALLHALERYQGAEAKGDAEWALVQARAVRDLSSALEEYLANDTAVADLRDAFAGEIDAVTADLHDGAAFVNRVRTSGFTADERRALLNRGVTAADITDLENDWVADGPARALTSDEVMGMFDAVLAADDATRQALQDSATGWDSIVSELEKRVDDDIHPEADAGGPYAAPQGDVTLDATASTASPAAKRIVAYAWDLDGDGQFDDATGGTPTVHVDGSRTIAVQVTDDNGRQATDFAQVTVTGGNRAPAVQSATPAAATTVTVGKTAQFSVTSSDPDGDPVSYSWSIDGDPADGSGPALTYQASADAVGEHVAQVTVTDGHAATVHQWSLSVVAPDADHDGWTATPDCDDTRADVHPGAYERPGNGLDDDCDSASPDGPPGGLTGSVMGWGSASGVGLPPRANQSLPYYSPVAVPSLGSSVTALESDHAAGYAVLADGTVRSWGLTYYGRLGTGDTSATTQWNPTPVLNLGGAAGSQLSGVTQVSAQVASALAVRSNGTVVAWGQNLNHELGDNSSVGQRTAPVNVLAEDGTPLSGVASVEMGEGSAYAVMRDGTVRDWGEEKCDADAFTTTRRAVATANPRFGTDVVQIASGDGGGALVRKADGSLWSCGGYEGTLGRPYTNADKADLRPVTGLNKGVVDVSMGSSAAVALREDGSVWVWGKNVNHSLDVLGLASGYTQETPVQVTLPAGPPVLDVEADYSDTFHAVRADGSVLAWGANTYGSAGDGTTGDHVVGVAGIARLDLGGARAVSESGTDWNGLALVRPADDTQMEVPAQYVTASVADTDVTEGTDGSATLNLSGPAPYDLSVTYTVGDGPQQTAGVAKGHSTAELPVSVPDNGVDEPDWTLPLQVVSVSHAVRVTGAAAVVTVHDDDAAPRVSVGDVRVPEGSTSLTDVSVPVTLSEVSARDVEVSWTAVDGTATAPADYAQAHGVAIIPAGRTSTAVHLSVVGDTVVEPDEQLTVRLSEPVDATLGTTDGTVRITDDEPLPVTVGDATVTEGDAGTTPVTFTVSAPDIPDGETLTVPWSLRAGTAELGDDVEAARGEITLTAGSPSAEVTAQVVGDTVAEPTETFRLQLGRDLTTDAGRAAIPLDGGGVGTVVDNDTAVSVDAGPDVSGGEGSPIALHGTASAPATWSVDDARCEIADAQALDTTVTCADDLVTTVTLTTDGGNGRPVSDTASLTVANLAPTLRVVSPADGTSVDVGQTVGLQAEVADPGSDEVSCSVAWGDGTTSTGCSPSHVYGAVGSRTITVTADDGEGGTATASVTLHVVGLPFDGFFPPVDNPPAVNVIKAGSSVPMKFSLHGYRGMDVIAAGYPASSSHVCGSSAGGGPLEPTGTPGSSQLSYDQGSDRYQYVWQTAKSWAGQCRTFTLQLRDGSVHTAEFRLR